MFGEIEVLDPKPKTLRANEMAHIVCEWQSGAEIDRTPYELYERICEEVEELGYASIEEDNRAIADEAIDILILTLQTILQAGYDPETLFLEKMETIYQKYPPEKVRELKKGNGRDGALQILKNEWST
jgi:NTP pyrophosphatase (non-canonical NTP hydrolase)